MMSTLHWYWNRASVCVNASRKLHRINSFSHLVFPILLSQWGYGLQYAAYSKLQCTSWSIVSTCMNTLLPLPPSFWFADVFRILSRIRHPTLIIVEYLWWVCETFPDDIIANKGSSRAGVQRECSAFSNLEMYLFHIALIYTNLYQFW